jgi:hypothetical protein
MIKKRIIVICALCTGFYLNLQAQTTTIQSRPYPQNYFRYPLDLLPPTTAGSFGELRPAHFHSGLDFKTNQRTGYPVYAVNVIQRYMVIWKALPRQLPRW